MSDTETNRRRPWLAALLALVVSGLGHAYLRRWARAFGWYAVITATLVFVVPDTAVDLIVAGDRPPVGDIAPALVVVAASVIDAYVLALRNNRTLESERRARPPEQTDARGSANRSGATPAADSPDRSPVDGDGHADAASCPHCGRETDPSFNFCQWCAEPVSER